MRSDVLGRGRLGTALARLLQTGGNEVTLWGHPRRIWRNSAHRTQ